MKKIMIPVVCLLMAALLLIGCGAQKAPAAEAAPEEKAEGFVLGGWTANEEDTSMEANSEAAEALEKAVGGMVGAKYEPIACLGKQVVSGTNYCLLCRITPVVPSPVSHFALVYVYQALDGSAELLEVQDLTIGVQGEA